MPLPSNISLISSTSTSSQVPESKVDEPYDDGGGAGMYAAQSHRTRYWETPIEVKKSNKDHDGKREIKSSLSSSSSSFPLSLSSQQAPPEHVIANIHPLRKNWILEVRITKATSKQYQVMTYTWFAVDANGDLVTIVTSLDIHAKSFEIGSCYRLSKCTMDNKTGNIRLHERSILTLMQPLPTPYQIPIDVFRLRSVKELICLPDPLDPNVVIDFMGIVSTSHLQPPNLNDPPAKQFSRQVIRLFDESFGLIELTITASKDISVSPFIEVLPGSILGCCQVGINQFRGNRNLKAIWNSRFHVNPAHTRSLALRNFFMKWIRTNGLHRRLVDEDEDEPDDALVPFTWQRSLAPSHAILMGASKPLITSVLTKLKNVRELTSMKLPHVSLTMKSRLDHTHYLVATIVKLQEYPGKALWYNSCPRADRECLMKVAQHPSGLYQCLCLHKFREPRYRLMIKLLVSDHTGSMLLSALEPCATIALKVSAAELAILAREIPPLGFRQRIAQVASRGTFLFQVLSSQDDYGPKHDIQKLWRLSDPEILQVCEYQWSLVPSHIQRLATPIEPIS